MTHYILNSCSNIILTSPYYSRKHWNIYLTPCFLSLLNTSKSFNILFPIPCRQESHIHKLVPSYLAYQSPVSFLNYCLMRKSGTFMKKETAYITPTWFQTSPLPSYNYVIAVNSSQIFSTAFLSPKGLWASLTSPVF